MNTPQIKLKTEFFEEDGQIIGIAPEINVGSSGIDLADAQRSLREAIELWIEDCSERGVLKQILEEDGFTRSFDDVWVHREAVLRNSAMFGVPNERAMA